MDSACPSDEMTVSVTSPATSVSCSFSQYKCAASCGRQHQDFLFFYSTLFSYLILHTISFNSQFRDVSGRVIKTVISLQGFGTDTLSSLLHFNLQLLIGFLIICMCVCVCVCVYVCTLTNITTHLVQLNQETVSHNTRLSVQ